MENRKQAIEETNEARKLAAQGSILGTFPGTCPYCSAPLDPIEAHNSLSRWLDGVYICNHCGDFEAAVDMSRHNARIAFTALSACIGVAVEGQPGYYPLAGDKGRLIPYTEATAIAEDLNSRQREPISPVEAIRIVYSTMKGQSHTQAEPEDRPEF